MARVAGRKLGLFKRTEWPAESLECERGTGDWESHFWGLWGQRPAAVDRGETEMRKWGK